MRINGAYRSLIDDRSFWMISTFGSYPGNCPGNYPALLRLTKSCLPARVGRRERFATSQTSSYKNQVAMSVGAV